jgi:SAM-dependent methyltransferase
MAHQQLERNGNKNRIKETLLRLGIIEESNIEIFSTRTREEHDVTVFRDRISGVIFIDKHFVNNEVYISGEWERKLRDSINYSKDKYQEFIDNERRLSTYMKFIISKSIVDFGCGSGSFLRQAKTYAKNTLGVEIEQSKRDSMNSEGIKCYPCINECESNQEAIFMFHCLHYLPDPSHTLKEIYNKLAKGGVGKLIVEVPHARDFLIDELKVGSFIEFTLSEFSLLLHTRQSLELMLEDAGFKYIQIDGIQRYSIGNHINWLKHNKPGGHKEILSTIETKELVRAYADALSKIDANDTLVAIAQT